MSQPGAVTKHDDLYYLGLRNVEGTRFATP